MNATIIIGTDQKGCTFQMKELLLEALRDRDANLEVREFYLPSEAPGYCVGCKRCFVKGEQFCPHYDVVKPIWDSILWADVMVFIYPQYVMRVPGHLKSLLDHFGVFWFAHRPQPKIFNKRALVITQGIGAPCAGALKDVTTSLTWFGVSNIHTLGIRLMEGVIWEDLSEIKKREIATKINKLAKKAYLPLRKRSLRVHINYILCRAIQRKLVKSGKPLSLDTQYWIDNNLI